MKVFCDTCKKEFDWDSEDIFMHPYGYTIDFTCRDCLKESKKYQKGKITLQR